MNFTKFWSPYWIRHFEFWPRIRIQRPEKLPNTYCHKNRPNHWIFRNFGRHIGFFVFSYFDLKFVFSYPKNPLIPACITINRHHIFQNFRCHIEFVILNSHILTLDYFTTKIEYTKFFSANLLVQIPEVNNSKGRKKYSKKEALYCRYTTIYLYYLPWSATISDRFASK